MQDLTQLVEQAAEGDTDAFTELVRRYRGLVFSTCFQRTGNWDDSEDLTQDVFVAAHRGLASVKEPEKLAAWLRGVADNVCKMHWRKQAPPMEPIAEEEPESPESRKSARSLELQDMLHRALSAIPEGNREVVSLHYLGGYSYAEIAGLCGLPVTTVRSRLHEARQQLKSRLLQVVEELCRCRASDDHVACIIERCGTEGCACAERLREE